MQPFRFRGPDKPIAEMRVHGVGGTPPEDMLDDPNPVQVSGDDKAGFFRRSSEPPDRNVEAYSWGGLTSQSALRPLWLLLLPFTLVNLAGWMVEIDPTKHPSKRQPHAEIHERLVRVIAALMTVNLVAWVAALTVDTIAFKCGSSSECRADHAWLGPLGKPLFSDHPGRLVVAGVAIALAVFALVDLLAKRVRTRYEEYQTDEQKALLGTKEAGARAKITDPAFWYRPSLVRDLAWLHRAAVLCTVTAVVAWTFASGAAGDERDLLLRMGALFGLAACIAALAPAALRPERVELEQARRTPRVARATTFIAVCALVALAIYAWADEPLDAELSMTLFRRLPFFLLAAEVVAVVVITLAQLFWWLNQTRPWFGDDASAGAPHRGRGVVANLWAFALLLTGFALIITADARAVVPATLFAAAILVKRRRRPFLWAAALPAGLAAWAAFRDGEWAPAAVALTVVFVCWAVLASEATWRANVFRWGAAAVLPLLGTFLLAGVFTGAAIRLVDFLDKDDDDLTETLALLPAYRWFAVAFAAGLVLTAVAGIASWLQSGREARGLEDRLGFPAWPQSGAPAGASELAADRMAQARAAVEKSIRLLRMARNGDLLLTALCGLTGVGLGIGALSAIVDADPSVEGVSLVFQGNFPLIAEWSVLETASSWLLAALPVGLVAAFRSGARDPVARRRIGILWDLGTFWPRRFHPFAPPSYPERAVPELQQRIQQATGAGRKVALLGHSQGSILSFAALAPWSAADLRRVTLVTYGSPLTTFYRRFFPVYFTSQMFHDLGRRMKASPEPNARGWRNFFRWTDPIGAPVFTEEMNDPPFAGATDEHAGHAGKDVRLYDPWWWWDITGQPLPYPLGHSNYLDDPQMSSWTQTLWRASNEP